MNTDWIHFLSTLIWGTYGLVVGVVVVIHGYNNSFTWISIIVAIVGNSAHLVAFAYSKGRITVQATKQ